MISIINVFLIKIIYASQDELEYDFNDTSLCSEVSTDCESIGNSKYNASLIDYDGTSYETIDDKVQSLETQFFLLKKIQTSCSKYYESEMSELQTEWEIVQKTWESIPHKWKKIKEKVIDKQRKEWAIKNKKAIKINKGVCQTDLWEIKDQLWDDKKTKVKLIDIKTCIIFAYDEMFLNWMKTKNIYERIVGIWNIVGLDEYCNGNWENMSKTSIEIDQSDSHILSEWDKIKIRFAAIQNKQILNQTKDDNHHKCNTNKQILINIMEIDQSHIITEMTDFKTKIKKFLNEVKEIKTETIITEKIVFKNVKTAKLMSLILKHSTKEYESKTKTIQNNIKTMRTVWNYCIPLWDEYPVLYDDDGQHFLCVLDECERGITYEEDLFYLIRLISWHSLLPLSIQRINRIMKPLPSKLDVSRKFIINIHKKLQKCMMDFNTILVQNNKHKNEHPVGYMQTNDELNNNNMQRCTKEKMEASINNIQL